MPKSKDELDRDWWKELETLLGWKLYAWNYRNEADFFTEKTYFGTPARKQEITGKMRDDIVGAIRYAQAQK